MIEGAILCSGHARQSRVRLTSFTEYYGIRHSQACCTSSMAWRVKGWRSLRQSCTTFAADGDFFAKFVVFGRW